MGELINKVTVVSGLFYIGRDRWKYSGFPPGVDRYKSWVTNLLSLDIHLYFYVDDYYYEYVLEHRKKVDPNLEKTRLIKTSLDELEFYKKHYNDEACLMNSPEFKKTVFFKDSADMNYPLYHIVNFSKIEFVKRSAQENQFESSYFFWVDAGALRGTLQQYENVKWPNVEKDPFNIDQITHFTHNLNFSVNFNNKANYFLSQERNIQGTAWIVPREKVQTFYNMIDNEVTSTIRNKIVGSDEKIYDSLYTARSSFYNLIQCGWFEFYNILQ